MKKFRTGVFCLCFLAAGAVAPGLAQQQANSAADQQQNPPVQNPTSQNPAQPPQQKPPAQAPPQQQQNPPAQQESTAPQQQGAIVNAAPELPKYPDVRLPGEYGWYFGVEAWTPKEHPTFDKGRNSGIVNSSFVTMQGTPTLAESAEFGIALGLHNALRISGFQSRAQGNLTTPANLTVWDQTYAGGTVVSTDYKIQNFKISFDYLTWPYPVESRRFRLKTLWQVQYTNVKANFDAPQLPLTDSLGNPIIDANGNPISYAAQGSRWFLLPTLGLSATEYVTRNFRLELSGDGFTIPHHSTTWEAEATANIRVSRIEVRAGAKAFHFKTSTDGPYYLRGTLASVFFGIRWYSR